VLASVIRSSLVLVGFTVAVFVLLRDYTLVDPASVGSTAPSTVAAPQRMIDSRIQGDPADSNQMVIKAGSHGHFFVDARIRNRQLRFLVDTGASFVTLSQPDAERLGFAVHQLEYSGTSHTANGTARFAPIVIEEITIGDIVVRNVQASVIDSPMEGSLLGMTFLRKLAGFEVRNDQLILRW
jgi:aspartyl protease family protein